MHLMLTALALVILIAGVLASQKIENSRRENSQESVLSDEDAVSNEGEEQEEQTSVESKNISPTPTSAPDYSTQENINGYKYLNSRVVGSSSTTLTLESEDNVDVITNWYKEKIKNEGLNVTSFVVTKTNDNVLNKLVGANNEKEIYVEIKKAAADKMVKIEVSVERN